MRFEDMQLNRVILELRYDEGYLYWDKCGEMLLDIHRQFPEWKWDGVSTELARLKNSLRNMELVFNYSNIRFIQNEVENLSQFKEAIDKIAPLITEKFEIKKFKRVGNRYLYILPLENPDQGKKIIQKSPLIKVPEDKLALFGENSDKTAFVIHFENKNLHYRIEFVGTERVEMPTDIRIDERFNPKYGLRVDVDIAIMNEVNVSDFNCSDFVQTNKKFMEYDLIKLIQK